MANEMQRGNLTGTAIMRIPISGAVNISGKQMKELRFMPYSEFPEEGREDVLYIDTDGNAMYYWDGTEYISLSGGGSGGTSNYNELSNKPSINDITLTGNKTSADLGLQPTISDLATIRSGAASGATAVQPSDMETALASKQDVIDDLSDIRTGAAAGETAVQPSALETALSEKQDVISDLADIRSGASAGATALQPEDIDTLPTDCSSNPVSSGGTYNFVNSSIATNTAYFIGTFASVAELEAYTGTVTNNDYAFVTSTDSAGNTLYNRYKYNAATQTWSFEYAVNNTAFTTAQWAAIQSGMTSADKTKLDGIETGANKTVIDASPTSGSDNAVSSGGVHTALSGKQDTISDLSDIRSGAATGATALQQSDVSSTYSSSGTAPVNGTAVNAAIETLDVLSVGGSGKYISAIREEDGKIEATPTNFDTALSSSSTDNNAPTSKAVYDDQQRQDALEAEDRAAILLLSQLNGAHNLLDIIDIEKIKTLNPTATWNDRIMTLGGVDWEFKIDGSILVNGTAGTNGSYPTFANLKLPIDKYVMSGGSSTVKFTAFQIGSDAGSGYLLDVTSQTTQPITFIGNISANVTVTNVTIRPMITTLAVDTMDDRFFPYAKTNCELTVENVSQQSEINYAVNAGVKNLLDVQRPTTTTRTSYTPLANGGVELSCSNATWTSYAIADIPVEVGKEYIITFLLDESSGTSNFYFFLRNGDSSGTNLATKNYGSTTGNYEASFTPNNSVICLGIYLNNSATAATATAKLRCMIRPASITDSTFVPYAPSNRELYEMIQALQNNS